MPRLPLTIEHPENFYRGVFHGICLAVPLWLVIILSARQVWAAYTGS
jgi:hypothetical protein